MKSETVDLLVVLQQKPENHQTILGFLWGA